MISGGRPVACVSLAIRVTVVLKNSERAAGVLPFAGFSWHEDGTRNREFFYRKVLTLGNALLLHRERTIAFSVILG
jgi:hypothetical protein